MQDKNDIQILAVSRSMVPATGHELTVGGSVIPAGFPALTDDFHENVLKFSLSASRKSFMKVSPRGMP